MTIPMSNEARRMFLQVAWAYLHTPYRWGGDDPMAGIDCSGMAVECLKSIGAIGLHEDYSADSLWRKWPFQEAAVPDAGTMAFWFNSDGKATHVAICIDKEYCLTADGGGSATLTADDAIKQNAFVKIRRIDHRATAPHFINLFL